MPIWTMLLPFSKSCLPSMPDRSPLLALLAEPNRVASFDEGEWSLLLAEARACDVLPRLATRLLDDPGPEVIPARFRRHLVAAVKQGEALIQDVRREMAFVSRALAEVGGALVLLKGGAYVMAGLPPARGRTFSDLDILVRRNQLPEAESALLLGGWAASDVDEYDQRYYREWSHEIPPMTHRDRQTTVDLHHSLVMPTCRIQIDSERMISDVVPLPGLKSWWRLCDEDLVLHAASHLLLNSEFDHGLRDLGDIDLLLRHFERISPGFADRVLERAHIVGMGLMAEQCFALCRHFFRTPVLATAAPISGPLLHLLAAATNTRHPDTRPPWQPLAETLLMIREVSLRLPPALLARHLGHKAMQALTPAERPAQ